MTSNPFYNALLGLLYIAFVVVIMNTGSHLASPGSENNFLVPIGMLSLFVLSASIMAYIFLYQPIIMFLDGKRKEAVNLFWKTIAVFAGITAIILLTVVLMIK